VIFVFFSIITVQNAEFDITASFEALIWMESGKYLKSIHDCLGQ